MRFIILYCIFVAYIVLVAFGVSHHEPWRDEAHPWMAARENSLRVIIDDFKYERTPGLWTFILVPFAKAGFPYPQTMQIIHAGLAVLAVGLLLFLSPLPLAIKILFMFSYYMAYEYAVIARHYVLTIVLLFSIASIYARRFSKPFLFALLVVLLSQTNTYSVVPAAILMGFFAIDMVRMKKVTVQPVLALMLMLLAAVLTGVILYPDRSTPIFSASPTLAIGNFSTTLRQAIVPSFEQYGAGFFQSPLFSIIVITLTALCFYSFLVLLVRKKSFALMGGMLLGWILYINTFLHAGSGRHHALLLIHLLFFWWISDCTRAMSTLSQKVIRLTFFLTLGALLFVSGAYFTVRMYQLDYAYNFSGGTEMAMYMKKHGLEKMDTASYIGGVTESVLSYFPDTYFWYPEFGTRGYFNMTDSRYNIRLNTLTVADAIGAISKQLASDRPALFLASCSLWNPELLGYTLIYRSLSSRLMGEDFWLYANRQAMASIDRSAILLDEPLGNECYF